MEEQIFDAALHTVSAGGLTLDDVDAVVVSANDQVDGRVISIMVSAGSAAGVDRDVTMIASASEHALIYGCLRLLAGQGKNVLVLAWGKPSESVYPEHAELVSAEPFLLRPTGMNETIAAALQASRLAGCSSADFADAPMVSAPLTSSELPTRGDAVCGVILAVPDGISDVAPVAWIRGMGWATDRYDMGDRDLVGLPVLRASANQAYQMADLDPSANAVHAVEMQLPSAHVTGAALEALELDGDSGVQVNPSSGFDSGYSAHAAGLARMLAAARLARSDSDQPKTTVGATMHGFAGQGSAVCVFGPQEEH